MCFRWFRQLEFPDSAKGVILEFKDLKGSLCTISYTNGQVSTISSIGKSLVWANSVQQLLWRAPKTSDLTWVKNVLAEQIALLIPALTKVESVWDDPDAVVQGVVPTNIFTGNPEERSCQDYNFSLPGFDYLRVFYNETGWERLFPEPKVSSSRQMPANISQCAGLQVVAPPWVLYNRLKYDWMKESGAISSGVQKFRPMNYKPILDNMTYVGMCILRFEPGRAAAGCKRPPDTAARLRIHSTMNLDLLSKHRLDVCA